MSNATTMWIHFVVQGAKNRETNDGNFNIRINAENKTNRSSNNPFFRAIWWTYMYLFYNKRRRDYLHQCNELVYDFRDELKKHFNLEQIKEQ